MEQAKRQEEEAAQARVGPPTNGFWLMVLLPYGDTHGNMGGQWPGADTSLHWHKTHGRMLMFGDRRGA